MKKRLTIIVVSLCAALVALACVACSPQKQEMVVGGTGAEETVLPEVTVDWTPESECASCHTVQGDSMKDSACLAKIHADQGNECVTCHNDDTTLGTVHESATMTAAADVKRLRETKVAKELCLSCHVQEEIATITAASTILTDSAKTVVNPHALPENEDHAKTLCADCHEEHSGEPIEETAPSYCTSCHHADVYECHTCHE